LCFFLKNSNESGKADVVFGYGTIGDVIPITGDWDSDGIDTIGVYRPETGTFFLKNSNESGDANIIFHFGPSNATMIFSGDWNGNDENTVGIIIDETILFRLTNVVSPNLWENYFRPMFMPSTILINRNSTLVWQNHDNVMHNISGLPQFHPSLITQSSPLIRLYGTENILNIGFDSGDIKPGEIFEMKFEKPGLFPYFNKHNPEMQGNVVVFQEEAQMNVETELITKRNNSVNEWVTGIAFTPDSKMFFTEHHGDVYIIENGNLIEKPFLKRIDPENFPNEDGITPIYEEKFPVEPHGWRGIAVDPNYSENHYVYLTRMFKVFDNVDYGDTQLVNRHTQLVRFTDVNNTGINPVILIDDVPGIEHAGGPIRFGDDGKIYFGTGDNGLGIYSQDLSKLTGKILRINPDGSIPDDNPFENSIVYTFGHREIFGLAKNPITGDFIAVDNGPTFGDEIDLLESGGNYGWPVYAGSKLITPSMLSSEQNYIMPIWEWRQALGPSGTTFYEYDKIPELKNKLLVGTWNLGMIKSITLANDGKSVISEENLFSGYKPIMAVEQGPDGYIYFSTTDSIERIVGVNNTLKSSESFDTTLSEDNLNNFGIILGIIILGTIIAIVIFALKVKNRKIRQSQSA